MTQRRYGATNDVATFLHEMSVSDKAGDLWQAATAKEAYSAKNTLIAVAASKAPCQGSQTGAAYLESNDQ